MTKVRKVFSRFGAVSLKGDLMNLLVIEDDSKIASFVKKGFEQDGYLVDLAVDGEQGLHMCLTKKYDAAVIDILLPQLDGLSLIEMIRHNGISTPVLILSAKRTVNDRIKGLQKGGDDYLTKPFSFSELLVRVKALIRRSNNIPDSSQIAVGDLSMDLMKRVVFRGDDKIILQPREFALLEYFMRNPNKVLSKTLILEKIWDFNFDPQTNVVDVLVCRLRGKIDKDYTKKTIRTIRGVGYVLDVPA